MDDKQPKPAITAVARDAKGRILPGHSLNPSGRPRGRLDVVQYIRAQSQELIANLFDIAFNARKESDRIVATTYLIDRAYGKTGALEVVPGEIQTGPILDYSACSPEELKKLSDARDVMIKVMQGADRDPTST